jgi:hypothetical protein
LPQQQAEQVFSRPEDHRLGDRDGPIRTAKIEVLQDGVLLGGGRNGLLQVEQMYRAGDRADLGLYLGEQVHGVWFDFHDVRWAVRQRVGERGDDLLSPRGGVRLGEEDRKAFAAHDPAPQRAECLLEVRWLIRRR